MKIYFMSTPRGKSQYGENYEMIYKSIIDLGHQHTTNFLLDVKVDRFYISDITEFYKATVRDLKAADVCVFEVSVPSLAVGHLIGLANDLGKPIVALYTDDNSPFFLSGVDDESVQVLQYDLPSLKLKKILEEALKYAADQQDVRFNFFVSPRIQQYLDWIAKYKRLPRAVYLRGLLERDMRENKEWEKQK